MRNATHKSECADQEWLLDVVTGRALVAVIILIAQLSGSQAAGA
jgi:hypothetical protein